MTDPRTGSTDVVGFLFEDLPGLADMYLPAEPGLTILYGLNGAGKTRILQAIENAYRGVRGGAQLLVKVPPAETQPDDWEPVDEDDEWTPSRIYGGHIKVELCRVWDPQHVHGEDEWEPESVGSYVFERVYQYALETFVDSYKPDIVDPFLGQLDPERIPAVREEMFTQRLVLITPTGSPAIPTWTVSPAAMEDPDFPTLSKELRRQQQAETWEDTGMDPETANYPEAVDVFDGEVFELVHQETPLIAAARGQNQDLIPPFSLPPLRLSPTDFEHVDPNLLVRDSIRRLAERMTGTWRQFGSIRKPTDIWDLDQGALEPWVVNHLRSIEHFANIFYAAALLDAPQLTLTALPLQQWWSGQQPVEWRFGPRELSLDLMSSAELRWARWAIAHSVRDMEDVKLVADGGLMTLVDEPERALHRSAEAHMAAQLQTFSHQPTWGHESARHVIVSTHSPELLNLTDARLLEVRRDAEGISTASPLTAANRDELEALGLLPSDLLRRQRGFVMVEGEHDEKLLQHWIGPQLDELRISILNLRGARQLPATIDSQVLFDFTDAHLFVVLDNLRASELEDVWTEVLRLKKTRSTQEALDHLLATIDSRKSAENQWIKEWLSRALTQNREERLTPFSVEVPDIIDLVDVRHLVPKASSWTNLRAEFDDAKAEGYKRDFKKWLQATKGAHIDADRIVAAAPSDPPDIVARLLDKISSVLAV